MKKLLCIILLCSCVKNLPTKIEYKKLSEDYLGEAHIIAILDSVNPKLGLTEFKREFQILLDDLYPINQRFVYPFTPLVEKTFWQMWDIFFKEFDIDAYCLKSSQNNSPEIVSKGYPILIYKNQIITDKDLKQKLGLQCPQNAKNLQEVLDKDNDFLKPQRQNIPDILGVNMDNMIAEQIVDYLKDQLIPKKGLQ